MLQYTVSRDEEPCSCAGLLCRGGEHEYRLTKYLLSNYEEVQTATSWTSPDVKEKQCTSFLHLCGSTVQTDFVLCTNSSVPLVTMEKYKQLQHVSNTIKKINMFS
jgi:hypothetical protein